MDKKVALVTGGGRGIGKNIALRLSQDGFNVAVSDIDMESAQSVGEEIRESGGRSTVVKADVSNKEEVFEMVSSVVNEFGRLDVMVSNAGIVQVKPMVELTQEDLERMFRINVFGVVYCLQAAAEQMKKQGGGKIINASSAAGRRGSASYIGHYSASKFAVVGLTQSAAQELASDNITVNAYCPGIIDTDMWELLDRDLGNHLNLEKGKVMEKSLDKAILDRAGTPKDVAGLVSFLASKDSDYMTGQSLVIDGGMIFA